MKKSIYTRSIALLSLCSISLFTAFADDITVDVELTAGNVTIAAPAAIDFGSTVVKNVSQTLTIDFNDIDGAGTTDFLVLEDLKSSTTGYHTTLSVSDLVGATSTGNVIDSDNVTISFEGESVATLSGTVVPEVIIPTTLTEAGAGYVNFSSAITVLQRSTDVEGLIGKYGTTPTIKVLIDPYQAVDNYTGTITYTLIED